MVTLPEVSLLLITLGIVGIWRWGYWLLRVVGARFYRPATDAPPELTVSVVTPVYDENPERFIEAVESWAATAPDEIIAVIDHTDEACIDAFRTFAEASDTARLIVTDAPGKRSALRRGVQSATGDVIALVDSDVHWEADTKTAFLRPFADPDVGAVAPRQSVIDRGKWYHRVYDAATHLRFEIDNKWLNVAAGSLSVVSGRTAVYRREVLDAIIDDIEVERFGNQFVISGEDKFLTRRLHAQGWRSWYQATSRVHIEPAGTFRTFIKQTLRWRRNSIRSDMISLTRPWLFRRPALAYYAVDRFFAAFAILLAPLYFARMAIEGFWVVVALILVWWMLSRTVKLHPYLLGRRLRYLAVVPVYTLWSFVYAPLQIFTILTANNQGWLTRGDDRRYELPVLRNAVMTAVSMAVTVGVLVFYMVVVVTWRT